MPAPIGALMSGKSLLPAGVRLVSGAFARGDTVAILSPEGREIARGLVAYDAADAVRIAGLKTVEIEAVLGYAGPLGHGPPRRPRGEPCRRGSESGRMNHADDA